LGNPFLEKATNGDFKNVPECTGVVNVALGPYPNGTSEIKITTKSELYSHFLKYDLMKRKKILSLYIYSHLFLKVFSNKKGLFFQILSPSQNV
jgi:hypothetical protein